MTGGSENRFYGRRCRSTIHWRVWLVLWASARAAGGQEPEALGVTQSLKAEIVLTPEFCKTKISKGSRLHSPAFRKESFEVGKAACSQMQQGLRHVFASLAAVDKEDNAGAQVVLIPRFVDLSATRPGGPAPAYSDRELVVLLEWTAKDADGKPVWIETVQGSAVRRLGSVFTNDHKRIIEDAVKDLLRTSARKMSNAPEMRQLAP